MFKRKLLALDHHAPDSVNINDEREIKNLVLWLENQKIRRYKIENRGVLEADGPQWRANFEKYCKDLASPIVDGSMEEKLEWLIGYAVSLEYADDVGKYKAQTAENISKTVLTAPKVESSNPLDNMDFESADFKKGVLTLAQILNITPHPDHLITLQAVSKVVRERLSQEALDNPNNIIVKGKPFPFQEADLGFDMGDYVLNQAAKILRLLYIHDLRDLQTNINETIVAVQSITADPKTDTKLGQLYEKKNIQVYRGFLMKSKRKLRRILDWSGMAQRGLPQSKEALLKSYSARLKDDVKSLLENFEEIIKLAKGESDSQLSRMTQCEQDTYEMHVRSANIVRAGESLMKLVSDIKQYLILNDFPSVNDAITQNSKIFRQKQAEADQKLMVLRDDMAADLYDLEEEYYNSVYKCRIAD
ncbi:RNA transcription, translation and transport factor protein [Frankliniella fusca]|uniref:RNA transcription, translation and transport factor protein n=2 Tax=Frankliniella fusca TaxID=407009 RepID=A0AAE1LDM9_9NEOP|nr:RNA transcription, translation and transport factor protein [Frankliniella fusca]